MLYLLINVAGKGTEFKKEMQWNQLIYQGLIFR